MERFALHVDVEADDLEAAVGQALQRLDCSRADVDIDIVQTHSSCFLGLFGGKPARVSVRLTDRALIARQMAGQLLALSGLSARVHISQSSQQIELLIEAASPSLVIGRSGQTLEALQTLVATMTDRQTTDRTPILLDVDGYRARRQKVLTRLSARLVRDLRKTGRPVQSPPLPASERRVLHDIVRVEPDLQSHSKRLDGQRKVVVLQLRGQP